MAEGIPAGSFEAARLLQRMNPPQRKGFLQKLFETLDLPKGIVQNVLMGRFESAWRNTMDLAGIVTGLRLIPGMYSSLELSKKSDRPTWGLILDIVFDPLTWVSLGGAGAATSLSKTAAKTAAGQGLKKILGRQLSRQLLGRAWKKPFLKKLFAEEMEGLVRRGIPRVAKLAAGNPKKLTRVVRARVLRKLAPQIAAADPKALMRGIATKSIAGIKAGQAIAKIPPGIVSAGGIRVGLPFTAGRTVALAGKDPLAFLPPVALFKRGTKLSKALRTQEAVDPVRKVLSPISRMSPKGQDIARSYINESALGGKVTLDWGRKHLRGITKELAGDITGAISGFDIRKPSVESLKKARDAVVKLAETNPAKSRVLAKTLDTIEKGASKIDEAIDSMPKLQQKLARLEASKPGITQQVNTAVEAWQRQAKSMFDTETGLGLFTTEIDPEQYLSLQWTDEFADAVRREVINEGEVGRAYRALPGASVSPRAKFFKQRKHRTAQEFFEAGNIAEADFRKLAMRRVRTHHEVVARAKLVRQANTFLGLSPRAEPPWAKFKYVSPSEAGGPVQAVPRPRGPSPLQRAPAAGPPAAAPVPLKGRGPLGLALGPGRAAQATKTFFQLPDSLMPASGMLNPPKIPGLPAGMTWRDVQKWVPRQPKLKKLADRALQEWIVQGKGGNLRPRRGAAKALATYNNLLFKGPVTVGIGPFPNLAFVVRNAVSGVFQGMTAEEIGLRGAWHLPVLIDDIIGKVARAFRVPYKGARVNRLLRGATEGLQIGVHSGDEVMDLAQRHNVLGRTFSAAEFSPDAISQLNPTMRQRAMSFARDVTEGVEQRMRLSSFTQLLEKGMDPSEAARITTDAFLDYRMTSEGERLIRDIFPFAKFTLAQTPRTLETVARRPVFTQPFRALARGQPDEPVPPFIEAAPRLKIGEGEAGPLLLTQFGTPLEDLARLGTGEGVGRTIEKGVIGSASPPLKLLYTMASGREPFFGRDIADPARAPRFLGAIPEALRPALGLRTRQFGEREVQQISGPTRVALANLPVTRQLRDLDKLLDDQSPFWARLVDFVTGAKIYRIDRDMELRRRVRDYLIRQAREGNLDTFRRFTVTAATDPQIAEIVKAYYRRKPQKTL